MHLLFVFDESTDRCNAFYCSIMKIRHGFYATQQAQRIHLCRQQQRPRVDLQL